MKTIVLSVLLSLGLGATTAAAQTTEHRRDFDALSLNNMGVTGMAGIWSDGRTMWVTQGGPDTIIAFDLETKTRRMADDFTSLHADNTDATGIWSDGAAMWVVDDGVDTIYTYDMTTKAFDASYNLHADNTGAAGLWSDGTTVWVVDATPSKEYVYTYNLPSLTFDASFNLNAGNANPRGIWSDGETLWVTDIAAGNAKVYAYDLQTLADESGMDFNTLEPHQQHPRGLWADDDTMWIVNGLTPVSIFAYDVMSKGRAASYGLRIAAAAATATEADGAVFTVSRSEAIAAPVTISLAIDSSGGVTNRTTATVTIPANQASAMLTVSTVDDDIAYEPDGGVTARLGAAPAGYHNDASGNVASVLVTDDDGPPTISVENALAAEGTTMQFNVRLAGRSADEITVEYDTSGNTATAGVDYDGASGVLTIRPNERGARIEVSIREDDEFEGAETFTLTLSNPASANFAAGAVAITAIGEIRDVVPVLSVADAEASEGEVITFTARLNPAARGVVTVAFATADDTATAGVDYDGASGVLTFAVGATHAPIRVPTAQDDSQEGDETFRLVLSSPTNAAFNANATVTAVTVTGRIRETLSAAQVKQLNEALTPYLAASINDALGRVTRDRAVEALSGGGRGGFTVQGTGLLEFIAAQSGGGRGGYGDTLGDAMDWGRRPRARSYTADDIHLPAGAQVAYRVDGESGGPGAGAFTVWARGYQHRLNVDKDVLDFKGDVTGGMLGIDTFLGDTLVGVGFNHAESDARFNYITESGSAHQGYHLTTLSGIHPYFAAATGGGGRVWGGVGVDTGEVEVIEGDNKNATPTAALDVEMQSVRLGGENPVYSGGGNEVGLIGDVALARLEDTETKTDGFTAKAGRLRLGVKADLRRSRSPAFNHTRGFEMVLRHDFGGGVGGVGVELGGKLRFGLPRAGLSAGLSGRALVIHADKTEDWGVGADLAWAARPDGGGFSVAFKPQWGEPASAAQTLWRHGADNLAARPAARPAARYRLEAKYGLALGRDGERLTLFTRGHWASARPAARWGADYRLSDRFTAGYTAVVSPAMDRRGYIRYHWRF